VAGGVDASKPRPALVIQDDHFDQTESVTVAPLTSRLVDAPLLRLPVPANTATGLETASHVMVDKVTTIRRSAARTRLGSLTAAQMRQVDRALAVFLGMGG
jgi:mRNA interferase MazF